jgi:hypothetical protein
MAVVILCPACGVRLTLGDDRAGTTLPCPICETAISVPVRESSPRPALPPLPRPVPSPVPRPVPPPLPLGGRTPPPAPPGSPEPEADPWHGGNRLALWILGGVALLLVGGLLGWLVHRGAPDRPDTREAKTNPSSGSAPAPTSPSAEPRSGSWLPFDLRSSASEDLRQWFARQCPHAHIVEVEYLPVKGTLHGDWAPS